MIQLPSINSALAIENRRVLGLGVACLAMLLLLLLNAASSGVSRTGGDDSGSGIGGTGRTLSPGGGSGFGGTGLKPFLGLNETGGIEILISPTQSAHGIADSVEIEIDALLPINIRPIDSPVLVHEDALLSRDSGAIDISEAIQRRIDENALALLAGPAAVRRSVADAMTQPASDAAASLPDSSSGVSATTDSESSRGEESTRTTLQLSWTTLSEYMLANSNEGTTAIAPTEDEESANPDSRSLRPERIQRPEIPPVQRYRPIQRAAILPPRIKPLSL